MPGFELVLLIRKLERPLLKEVLKRNAGYVFETGGTLRSIENLGLRNIPYAITSGGKRYIHAHYFLLNYDAGLDQAEKLKEKIKLDGDVVRGTHWLNTRTVLDMYKEKEKPECTLHLDLLPAPYRPNVIALQELQKRKMMRKKDFKLRKNFQDTDFLIT